MARFSTVDTLSPTGTVIAVGPAINSNAIATGGALDARIFLDTEVVAAGGLLDTEIQISEDNVRFVTIATFDQINAIGAFIEALQEHKLSKFLKLRYTATIADVTVKAKLEVKQGT